MLKIPSLGDFQTHLKLVLQKWSQPNIDTEWFSRLAACTEVRLQEDLHDEVAAQRRLVMQALDRLGALQAEAAALLRTRYVSAHKMSVQQVAMQEHIVEGTVYKKQRSAIEDLAQVFLQMEEEAIVRRRNRLLSRLEAPSYTELFGIEGSLDYLEEHLLHSGPPWIIAIEGMGGLGKTALADRLMRRMIDDRGWSDLAWITARHSYFNLRRIVSSEHQTSLTPASLVEALLLQTTGHAPYTAAVGIEGGLSKLRDRFHAFPHLVVIDNLESIADMEAILDTLRLLVGPSKFLLTTRECPYAAGDIFHFRTPELTPENALRLLRHEAEQRNLPDAATADDAYLLRIVDVVGGNPLALRLIVGQLHVHALDDVLIDLADVRSEPIDNMYTYLYRQAWDGLDEEARSVLLRMPLVTAQGEDLEYLSNMGSLDENDLRVALNRLVELNLVDAIGDITNRRYAIHSLTRTFLQRHIVKW